MEQERQKVLVVEDEQSIRKFIEINLSRSGFLVIEAGSGEEAMEAYEREHPAIAVLDVMLPGMDGFLVCQALRERDPNMIIIMLTAKAQDMDKVVGLEIGADDYMVKPFNPVELVARIRAHMRKMNPSVEKGEDRLIYKELHLDLSGQKFFRSNMEIELTPTEMAIIKVLLATPGKAFSRDELLNIIWGKNYFGDMKTVDVHIRRLREKIEVNPSNPQYIETVWGFGYRLGEKV